MAASLRARAFAKINLTLHVLGVRADGYHELRTVYQSLALHDTLVVTRTRGPFAIACDDPACPTDRANLVWRAAERLWNASGRRGTPRGLHVSIRKRIPTQAGLGGGSSDAAAALRACAAMWRVRVARERMHEIAAGLGADVPYFLDGGTALGLERGDLLFPLEDVPAAWVALVLPPFGVSTREAYGWFDARATARRRASAPRTASLPLPAAEIVNDLQAPVVARHAGIGRLVRSLERAGARHAAMSGSGSAVFGLFDSRLAAERALGAVAGRGVRVVLTRTLGRRSFQALAAEAARILR